MTPVKVEREDKSPHWTFAVPHAKFRLNAEFKAGAVAMPSVNNLALEGPDGHLQAVVLDVLKQCPILFGCHLREQVCNLMHLHISFHLLSFSLSFLKFVRPQIPTGIKTSASRRCLP